MVRVMRLSPSIKNSIKQLHRMGICPKICFICQANRDKKAARKAQKALKKAP